MDGLGKPPSTSALWERLFKAASIEQFVEQNARGIGLTPFPEYVNALCKERGTVADRVIKKASIERSFGHSVFRGDRHPSRDTVIQLAFGFEADMELAQSLLKHSGYSPLYPRVPRDIVISYCLFHKASIVEKQQTLMQMELPLIGGAGK